MAAVVALVIFVWGENAVIPSFQKCIGQEAAAQGHGNAQKERFIIGRFIGRETVCTARLLDSHSGLIGALAGLAVAGFTATLWLSTKRLWLEAERQRKDARDAHEASLAVSKDYMAAAMRSAEAAEKALTRLEIPYLYPVDLEYRTFINSNRVTLLASFRNYGRSPAILKNASLRVIVTLGNARGKQVYTNNKAFQVDGLIGDKETSDPIAFELDDMTLGGGIAIGTYQLNVLVDVEWVDVMGQPSREGRWFVWNPKNKRFVYGVQLWEKS